MTSLAASTSDQSTSVSRERSEVSPVSEGSHGGEGGACEEGEGEEEDGAEEEEDASKWGPLKVPVTVKIADLGNACWVVSVLVRAKPLVCVCMGPGGEVVLVVGS